MPGARSSTLDRPWPKTGGYLPMFAVLSAPIRSSPMLRSGVPRTWTWPSSELQVVDGDFKLIAGDGHATAGGPRRPPARRPCRRSG